MDHEELQLPERGSLAAFVAAFLAPLTSEQQTFVDIVGAAVASESRWPVFDHLEAEFDKRELDAWGVLESFPVAPNVLNYSAIRLPRNPGNKPHETDEVALTLLGLYHQKTWGQEGATGHAVACGFVCLVRRLAKWRREQPSSPTTPRILTIESSSSFVRPLDQDSPGVPELNDGFLAALMDGEPATWRGSVNWEGGRWARGITRDILPFEHVSDLGGYLTTTLSLRWQPPPRLAPAAPSPLSLVAALDYLDTVWRLTEPGSGHLFELRGAQRTAQLAMPANNKDEFDSRLTGLAELLRTVKVPTKTTKKNRDKPLLPLVSHIAAKSPHSEARVKTAVATLHHVIDLRDASQHSTAASKGVRAFEQLAIDYPPWSWGDAWQTVAARTIEALDAIREELEILTP